MLSFERYVGPDELVAEMRMQRQAEDVVFLLLEGDTDVRRFDRFFDQQQCSTVNCWGKRNLLLLLDKLESAIERDFVAFADSDFDRVTGELVKHDCLIYSEGYDFDIDVIRSTAFDRYFREVTKLQKLEETQTGTQIRNSIVELLSFLSAARFAKAVNIVEESVGNLSWDDCIVHFSFNRERLAEKVLRRAATSHGRQFTRVDIKNWIDKVDSCINDSINRWDICNGHDFCRAFGILLRSTIGNRSASQTQPQEIEMHLRLAYSQGDFLDSSTYRAVVRWTEMTGNGRILSAA
jgi:hypothetical protein